MRLVEEMSYKCRWSQKHISDRYYVFSGRDQSQEAQGWGELHTAFVWTKEGQDAETKKYGSQSSWRGLGHGGENAHYFKSENWTKCLARVGTFAEETNSQDYVDIERLATWVKS